MVEPPPCDAYNATARRSPQWDNPCTSYSNVCALPNVVGQLWSRRVLYELIVARETRTALVFDSIIFLRPDLAAAVPLPPLCSPEWQHDWRSTPIGMGDWLVWVPRHLAAAVFQKPSEAFARCELVFGSAIMPPTPLPLASLKGQGAQGVYRSPSPEEFLIHAAGLYGAKILLVTEGTRYADEPLLGTLTVLRPLSRTAMPMGMMCTHVSRGLDAASAVSHPSSQLLSSEKGARQPHLLLMGYTNSRADAHRSPAHGPSCWRLLMANPFNSPPATASRT